MDPQAFEMFMNASIAKYRERQDQRSKTLVSSFLETGSTKSIARGPRNPLRLLSSRAIGLVNQDIKLSPFLEQVIRSSTCFSHVNRPPLFWKHPSCHFTKNSGFVLCRCHKKYLKTHIVNVRPRTRICKKVMYGAHPKHIQKQKTTPIQCWGLVAHPMQTVRQIP